MSRGVGLSPILGLVPWELDDEALELVSPDLRSPWVLASTFQDRMGKPQRWTADTAKDLIAASPELSCPPCELGPLTVNKGFASLLGNLESAVSMESNPTFLDRPTWRALGLRRVRSAFTVWQALRSVMTDPEEVNKLGRSALGQTSFESFTRAFLHEGNVGDHTYFSLFLLIARFGPGEVEALWVRSWVEDVKLTLPQAYFVLKTDHTAPLAWAGVLA